MNDTFEKRLIECLDALEQGESLEAILARYPESAVELRPLLETAVSLQTLKIQPTLATQQRSKTQFLQTAVALRENKTSPPFWLRLQRLLLPAAGLVVLLFLLSATLIPASAQAVPGDALYATKQFIEEARLRLTSNADGKLKLVEEYNQERIAEINTLLAEGRQANVSFRGPIQAFAEQTWTIAGLTTRLAANVIIEGAPEIGLTAIVTGQTKDGELVALMILVPDGGKPLPSVPTPTLPAPSATPSAIPSATQTISSPTASPTASPTPSPTLTATPYPSPTATATLKPTETAVPPSPTSPPAPPTNDNDNTNDNDDDNVNDNENDNDNENENDNDNDNDNSDDEANENDGT